MSKKCKIVLNKNKGGIIMMSKKKRVSIGLTEKQYELVEKLSKEKGFSKSAIFVLALEEYARKDSEEDKKK